MKVNSRLQLHPFDTRDCSKHDYYLHIRGICIAEGSFSNHFSTSTYKLK